jgi:hypothetical protein
MPGTVTETAHMRRRILRALGLALVAAPLAAAAPAGAGQTEKIGKGKGSRPEEVTRTSRPLRLLRSWEETVKLPGGKEYPRRVEVVFDYAQGVAFENSFRLDGLPLGSRTIEHGLPAPSPEEIEEAFEIVRVDPDLIRLFGRFHVVLEGGFVLEERKGQPCGPGARCLHVFLLSSDRAGLIRRVVVDLASRRLAYRLFDPDTAGGSGK